VKKLERYRKAAVYTLIIFGFYTLIVLFSELPLIDPSQQTAYLWTKLLFIFPSFPLAYFLNRNITSQTINALVGIDWFLYAMQGQWFRPLYMFSFCELAVTFAIIFPVSKKIYRWIVSVGLVLFLWVVSYRWQQFVELSQHPAKSDIVLAVLAFAITGWITNTFFTSERLFREEAVLKFAKIGTQTSRIVHDLKGLTSSPLLYLQVLESRLPPSLGKEVTEAMQLLARDLEGFRKVLFELNQLTASKVIEVEQFSSDDVIGSFQVILKKQLAGISLETSGTMSLETDKSLLTSVFLNILMNSVETFKEREVRNPRIRIAVIENRISFQDNGGGFEKKVLRNISDGRFISTRPNGSGLGLLFVFDGMKRIGGKAKVYNCDAGACVELQFPKGIIQKNSGVPFKIAREEVADGAL
jgi:signal transduction histidine kinase